MLITLAEPDRMKITDACGNTQIGGSQEWYENRWHRISGCGPVAASNLIWYMMRIDGEKTRYMELMREMFMYITPGLHGVNKSGIFSEGIVRYGVNNGLRIDPHVLEISPKQQERPDIGTVRDYIVTALRSDAPVALLNLSSGMAKTMENWHWMTIITFNDDDMRIQFCDYGAKQEADISAWIKTTKQGGAMIYLTIQKV